MEKYIIEKLKKGNLGYMKIENEDSLIKIYNLFKNKIFTEPVNGIEYLYYGVYGKIIGDYSLMKKYYLLAINQNESNAMNNLACYYENEKDYSLMKKYYLMAINQNDSNAMHNLALYYQDIEKDYSLMKKYFLMAISQNNIIAMYNLAYYYQHVEKDYGLMKKYYLLAINQNESNAMNNLAVYYQDIEKDYGLMKKYYLLAISQHNAASINNLKDYYKQNKNDHSFVELGEQFTDLFNGRFVNNINLEKEYYYSFLQWKTDNNKIKMKQYILRKTGVFPRKYNKNLLINFMEIISLKNTILPKDIIYLIAGHLFV